MARKGALHRIFDIVQEKFPGARRLIWKKWYKYINRLDNGADVIFMNYGYSGFDPNATIKLKELDEKDRYCIQLYHHVASSISLKNKDLLEIGCGRGGGSSYIKRYLKPRFMAGMDFSDETIKFCKKHYSVKGLSFYCGDAESIPFENNKFDVVINVESSHCYGNIGKFFNEIFRVLRYNGYFLFADFRAKEDIDSVRSQLKRAGFKIIKEENINKNVIKSLDADHERKNNLINQKAPRMFHWIFLKFAGAKGSVIYDSFKNGEKKYVNFVLQKKRK